MRHLDAARGLFVVEHLKGLGTPHLVDPGWRFVPRLLGRVSIPISANYLLNYLPVHRTSTDI
jgi:hypothetical protein